MALEDVVILNVDTNTLETPFDDLQSLPNDVVCMKWFYSTIPLLESVNTFYLFSCTYRCLIVLTFIILSKLLYLSSFLLWSVK